MKVTPDEVARGRSRCVPQLPFTNYISPKPTLRILGNLDLFTTTVEFERARHLAIEGLDFRRPQGRLRVRIRDEVAKPVGARVSICAADGSGQYVGMFNRRQVRPRAPDGD